MAAIAVLCHKFVFVFFFFARFLGYITHDIDLADSLFSNYIRKKVKQFTLTGKKSKNGIKIQAYLGLGNSPTVLIQFKGR